jgi:hypothetical protein
MDPSQWPVSCRPRLACRCQPYLLDGIPIQDDFVSWLLLNAPESDRTVPEITRRLLMVNFAAIHTSSLNLTHALYWLLARYVYQPPSIRLLIGVFLSS